MILSLDLPPGDMDDFIWREPMEEKIIIMKEVTKVFENGEDYLKALNHVSFEICRDEFVVIMGTSGSGKTTLLNLLAVWKRRRKELSWSTE